MTMHEDRPETPPRVATSAPDHELLRVFAEAGFQLNSVLHEMLSESHVHRTERRGGGYTQASRHIAEHVNTARKPYEYDEVRLFADRDTSRLRALMDGAAGLGLNLTWRNLDRQAPPDVLRQRPELLTLYEEEAARQRRFRELPSRLVLEESRLMAAIIVDLLLPRNAEEAGLSVLPPWPEKLPIGTCPLAEKYFLELAHGLVRRNGVMNVIVSEAGAPLLAEKLNLGDDHSCVSVAPLVLNGVRLPPGSLFGVIYGADVGLRPNRALAGSVLPLRQCLGFRFLRLTTLAVSPENRRRAFTTHFEAQLKGGLFEPGASTIEQIERMLRQQVGEP